MSFKKEILQSIQSLPPLGTAAQKILPLLWSDEADLSQIIDIIHYDPTVTGNVLKLVNSPYFGLSQEVASIKQAVVMMGLDQVHRIVVAVTFAPHLNQTLPGYDVPHGGLWEHSVMTAVAAETIAENLGFQERDMIFTAALLHDIGKLALASFVRDYFTVMDEHVRSSGESFEEAEKKMFGLDHAEAGAFVLKNWGIPEPLYMPVLWHHNPGACTVTDSQRAVDIIHLADLLSLTAGMGLGRDGLQYRPSAAVLGRLQLKALDLETMMSRTMTGLEKLKEIFEL